MAAVDTAREEAATQLFTEEDRANIGSLTLEPVGRLCLEQCLLMSEERVGNHVRERFHCDPEHHRLQTRFLKRNLYHPNFQLDGRYFFSEGEVVGTHLKEQSVREICRAKASRLSVLLCNYCCCAKNSMWLILSHS